MRHWKTTLILFLSIGLQFSASASSNPDLSLRDKQSLNGVWHYIVDPYENGYYDYRLKPRDQAEHPSRQAFFMDAKPRDKQELIEYDFDQSDTIMVPGDWNTQKKQLYYYEGNVWYRKTFNYQPVKNQRQFVYFGAVNYRADVYLNGHKLGVHIGGFTSFSMEATSYIKAGKNSLVLKVDNTRHKDAVPTVNTDWWNYGGITRDVDIVSVPATFIQKHQIALTSASDKTIHASVTTSTAQAGQKVSISLPELDIVSHAKTDASGTAQFSFHAPDLQLWQPNNPKMYRVNISTGKDKITDNMGFRTIRTEGKKLLLNDKPVFLRGIAIHDEMPLNGGGRVANDEQAKQLLLWTQQLGGNFARLAHYPHNEKTVRLAEQMGILVWSEIPVYWTIDWTNQQTYNNAENQLIEMIERDVNRANVIIWSVSNETPVNPDRTKFLGHLVDKARELDNSRLISAAMERHWDKKDDHLSVVEDPLADKVDLVSFNQYIGWYDGLPDKLAKVHWKIPYNKPVFISEFGAGAKKGLHGDKTERWTEEFQADLYKQTVRNLDQIDGLAGMSPWILVDFRSPRRVLPGIQDDFNRKGLISEDGLKKQAFFELRKYYREKAEQYE
ncbi:glycoside hydrolase family 2 protein [Neptunicella marina]|uniref:Beta galactosidase jelly roll domain-containing protein n=1 Tax=Neptunicella marina TaxID=2125989 RepID=A0A8J6M6C9_9ALTE|nr:glycoside hydrolase family 2 TIM barrel-domain containing protein [Neptunicella marina]MBC3767061.1 beta galactosidase jelly roll domain-containing protein [Neptunicella marina]